MKTFSIYYLIDPTDDRIRYIGYSRDPEKRYMTHVEQSVLRRTHKECWIASLLDRQVYPHLSIHCIVQEATEAKRIEVALIAAFRQRNVDLTNSTHGGDGSAGFKWSAENYEKHRIHWETIGQYRPRLQKGVQQSKEHIAATVAANTPELLARRGASIKAGWARRNGAPTKKFGKGWSTLQRTTILEGKERLKHLPRKKHYTNDANVSPAERLQRQIARNQKKLDKLKSEMEQQ